MGWWSQRFYFLRVKEILTKLGATRLIIKFHSLNFIVGMVKCMTNSFHSFCSYCANSWNNIRKTKIMKSVWRNKTMVTFDGKGCYIVAQFWWHYSREFWFRRFWIMSKNFCCSHCSNLNFKTPLVEKFIFSTNVRSMPFEQT